MPTDNVSSTETNPSSSNVSASGKGWWRWWLWIPLVLILILAALPSLLGSKWVYQKLVDRLAVEGFQLQIDAAEIGWFRQIAFRGIRLKQLDAPKSDSGAKDRPVNLLEIEAIESNRSLLGYLMAGRDLGQLKILRPKLDIELLEETSNLEKLVHALPGSTDPSDTNASKQPPRVDLQVQIEGLSVSVVGQEGSDPLMVVPPFNATFDYLAREGESRIVVSPTTVLDHVQVTQELVRLGLGRAIPLLAKSAWFDGSISLATERIEIPLERPVGAIGAATITLHEVRTGPSEPVLLNILDMIARFRRKDPVHELVFIDGSVIQIAAADGFIEHSGVQVGLPKIDPRLQLSSAGKVGMLDRSLDLLLGMPVPLEMLARRESVQQIGIPQINLPVRGTLDQPQVDWSAMRNESADLLSLVSAALGEEAPGTAAAIDVLGAVTEGQADEAIGAAVDVLKELRKLRQDRRARNEAERASSEPVIQNIDQQESRPPPRRPLRNALRNLRDGQNGP